MNHTAPGGGAATGNMANIVVDYDRDDKPDPTDIHGKTSGIKVEFNRQNVRFFFSQLEMHLESVGVASQWMKRLILQRNLPPDVIEDLEDLLVRGKVAAGNTAYFDVKTRILEIWGPRPEDVYKVAKSLVMTGKPSQLAKKLINTICPKHPTLVDCCSEPMISGMWRDKLPDVVRTAVANHSLAGGSLETTLRFADGIYASSLKPTGAIAAVKPAAGGAPAGIDEEELAAFRKFQKGQKKKQQKQTTKGAGSQQGGQSKPSVPQPRGNKGDPHPDGPPPSACYAHWQWGKSAEFCRLPHSCPWVAFTVPPTKR